MAMADARSIFTPEFGRLLITMLNWPRPPARAYIPSGNRPWGIHREDGSLQPSLAVSLEAEAAAETGANPEPVPEAEVQSGPTAPFPSAGPYEARALRSNAVAELRQFGNASGNPFHSLFTREAMGAFLRPEIGEVVDMEEWGEGEVRSP